MSSIMRWRSGLMGLSSIEKTPVSHGVEPHDLETGSSLRSRRHPFRTSPRPSPRLPRERFSPYVDTRRRLKRLKCARSGHSPTPGKQTKLDAQPRLAMRPTEVEQLATGLGACSLQEREHRAVF